MMSASPRVAGRIGYSAGVYDKNRDDNNNGSLYQQWSTLSVSVKSNESRVFMWAYTNGFGFGRPLCKDAVDFMTMVSHNNWGEVNTPEQ